MDEFNPGNGTYGNCLAPFTAVDIFYFCLCSACGLLAILLNSIIIFTISKSHSLRQNPSHYVLWSLCVADLTVGLVLSPVLSHIYASCQYTSADDIFFIQNMVSTTFSMSAVTLDRYAYIRWPLKYELYATNSRYWCAIFMVWVSSAAFAMPVLFLSEDDIVVLWLTVTSTTLILPFSIIMVSYAHIVAISRNRISVTYNACSTEGQNRLQSSLRNSKAAKTFAIIAGTFLLTFGPNCVLSIYTYLTNTEEDLENLWLWLTLLIFISAIANPLIYTMRNRELRRAVKRIMRLP
ncbi:cannabinoid receptor type 1B [Nematostella vectensis]|uniref:cannabinoid receptor type 1B n=1 Tax=Nematostella vectensis TaxID=45351 RepID=UPI002077292A|nr:cannabinoid receptor type 1B [Nematostella vectensis]